MEITLLQFIQKDHNFLLAATALASGAMLLWPVVRRASGGAWVGAAQATQLINREDALVLDVREQAEYDAGHVLGAKSLPLARVESGAGDVAKKKDAPLIVYCDRGDQSGKAAAALKKQGYTRVVNLTGGLAAWKQAGLPVEKK